MKPTKPVKQTEFTNKLKPIKITPEPSSQSLTLNKPSPPTYSLNQISPKGKKLRLPNQNRSFLHFLQEDPYIKSLTQPNKDAPNTSTLTNGSFRSIKLRRQGSTISSSSKRPVHFITAVDNALNTLHNNSRGQNLMIYRTANQRPADHSTASESMEVASFMSASHNYIGSFVQLLQQAVGQIELKDEQQASDSDLNKTNKTVCTSTVLKKGQEILQLENALTMEENEAKKTHNIRALTSPSAESPADFEFEFDFAKSLKPGFDLNSKWNPYNYADCMLMHRHLYEKKIKVNKTKSEMTDELIKYLAKDMHGVDDVNEQMLENQAAYAAKIFDDQASLPSAAKSHAGKSVKMSSAARSDKSIQISQKSGSDRKVARRSKQKVQNPNSKFTKIMKASRVSVIAETVDESKSGKGYFQKERSFSVAQRNIRYNDKESGMIKHSSDTHHRAMSVEQHRTSDKDKPAADLKLTQQKTNEAKNNLTRSISRTNYAREYRVNNIVAHNSSSPKHRPIKNFEVMYTTNNREKVKYYCPFKRIKPTATIKIKQPVQESYAALEKIKSKIQPAEDINFKFKEGTHKTITKISKATFSKSNSFAT